MKKLMIILIGLSCTTMAFAASPPPLTGKGSLAPNNSSQQRYSQPKLQYQQPKYMLPNDPLTGPGSKTPTYTRFR